MYSCIRPLPVHCNLLVIHIIAAKLLTIKFPFSKSNLYGKSIRTSMQHDLGKRTDRKQACMGRGRYE
jgi:hypothetical protein